MCVCMSAYFHSCYFFTFLYMFSQLLHFSSSKLFQLPLTLFMNQKCELLNFSRYHLFLRILLLLVLAWITLLLSNLVLIVVPISLGRALFNAIPLLPLTRGIKFPLFSVTLDIKFNGKIIVCTIFLNTHYHTCGMEILIFLWLLLTDIYAFILGNCIIRTVVTGSRYVVQHVQTGRAGVLLKQIWKWCGIALKSSALLSIWVGHWFSLVCY